MAFRFMLTRFINKEARSFPQKQQYTLFATATAAAPQINPKIIFIPRKKSASELQQETAVEEEKKIEDYKPTRLDPPRIKYEYLEKAVPCMVQSFNYNNLSEVPRLEKIVVHYGMVDSSLLAEATETGDMSPIVGKRTEETAAQKRKKKKANVSLKYRENVPISEPVTLRGKVMYSLLDRLISHGFPMSRDFKGLNLNNFDGKGTFRVGVLESAIFPEKKSEPGEKTRGLDIYVHTTAKTNREALKLLSLLGVPFREDVARRRKKKKVLHPKDPRRKGMVAKKKAKK